MKLQKSKLERELLRFLKSKVSHLANVFSKEELHDSDGNLSTIFGYTCGWVKIVHDGCELSNFIVDKGENLNDFIKDMVSDKIPKSSHNHLRKYGCNFDTIWMQCISMQKAYMELLVEFMKEKGIKGCYIDISFD